MGWPEQWDRPQDRRGVADGDLKPVVVADSSDGIDSKFA
jgi:hypothetical protein